MGQQTSTTTHDQLLEVAKKKIQQRDFQLNKNLAILNRLKQQLNITNQKIQQIVTLQLTQVVELLNQNKLSSVELVVIYSLRAGTIGKRFCFITQDNFVQALSTGKQCDKIRKQSKKLNWTIQNGQKGIQFDSQKYLPPLFGIPVSIKDTFDMKGFCSTIGLIKRAYIIKQKDSLFVNCMKNAGMIPFVRSNVSQLAMLFQTTNHLWGRSVNIFNQSRCVGGSSGGQAGLISAKCSMIGLGSDVAGSLRSPAQFCGIYSLKTSSVRLSTSGTTFSCTTMKGRKTLSSIAGPMSRSVNALTLWMTIATNQKFYQEQKDYFKRPIQFDMKKFAQYQTKKLKIGYFTDFDLVQSTVASKRAVNNVNQILKQLGHQVVSIKIPNQTNIIQAFYRQISAQGKARSYFKMLDGQKPIQQYQKSFNAAKLPSIGNWLISSILNKFQPRIGFLLSQTKQLTTYEYLENAGKVEQYRKQFFQYIVQQKLDLIIAPGFGCQAPLNSTTGQVTFPSAFGHIWNMLDMTVGCVPVTTVRQDQQFYQSKHKDMMTKQLQQIARNSKGLPVGIVVVGMPYEDQAVLGLMKVLQKKIDFYKNNQIPYIE